jgi:hypothetical protein
MEESTSAQVFAIVAPNERIEKIGLAPPLEIRGALQMECNALIRNVAKFTKQDFENGEFPTIPPASNGDPILTKVEDSFVQIKLLEIIQSNPPEGVIFVTSFIFGRTELFLNFALSKSNFLCRKFQD